MILPRDKFDFEACRKIRQLNDREISEIGDDLSTWLQDANFPIFKEVTDIFVLRQNILLPSISKIFYSNDSIWIYWILLNVYSRLEKSNKILLKPALTDCLNSIIFKKTLDEDDMEIKDIIQDILCYL
ncbi:DUF5071 domain-containing protein [Lachnoanaerobaculum sp. Marseille-Q4761]|jgi:hypothetical protein|uniref:DUF5071 domain-containing protein n=1 Tax=Lachnoanaerobaculum sp. Marseille-Q4761 TaxID=2819511 RepID=UPI001AA0C2AE|nr:DUF5071 domain-containing protein [Lachnoanaerobaculum sp. Marseille-Q4761]MBO1871506.1 DUF5071 domain-containing protein [Lachnoanaerobaculum sp. Marseille-Q4761]